MQAHKKHRSILKPVEATLQLAPIIGGDGQTSRCSKRSKGKTRKGSIESDRNGFLKHSFSPLFVDRFHLMQHKREIEKTFLSSVHNLCSLYGLIPPPNNGLFPANLISIYNELSESLSKINKDLFLIIVKIENRAFALATVKVFHTGMRLYYIALKPLNDLLQIGESKHTSDLILSIFSYLYHCLKVSWFCNTKSYLSGTYQCLTEWYCSSDESEDVAEQMNEMDEMMRNSKSLLIQIRNKQHLNLFEERLENYFPNTKWDAELLSVAKTFLELYSEYKYRRINMKNMESLLNPEEEDRVPVDGYVSFFWDANGKVYDDLVDYVNTSFQEYGVIDEPLSLQVFDCPQSEETHEMEFENKLFPALDELCGVLNTF